MPVYFKEDDYLYQEKEVVTHLHFCYKGVAGFVVPNLDNLIYLLIDIGDFLGLMDCVPTENAP